MNYEVVWHGGSWRDIPQPADLVTEVVLPNKQNAFQAEAAVRIRAELRPHLREQAATALKCFEVDDAAL